MSEKKKVETKKSKGKPNKDKSSQKNQKTKEHPEAFDLMKHSLVPEHTIMSKEEKEELLKKYNIDVKQLPKILENDPIVKQIGAKLGDVLKITRKSPTAGKSYYFRLVVSKGGSLDV